MVVSRLRLWTVDEYYQMAQTGLLHPEERVELLEGQIIQMTPQGPLHAATIDYTAELLREILAGKALVRPEKPLTLNPYSEPQPDVAVVHPHPRRYADRHPIPPQVYLLIEVADSSLNYDRTTKAKKYAQAGIRDYWILDTNQRQLHIFREPTPDGYTCEVVFAETDSVSPLAFPDVIIPITQMLPPVVAEE